jgi:hypothetical protein
LGLSSNRPEIHFDSFNKKRKRARLSAREVPELPANARGFSEKKAISQPCLPAAP